MMSVSGKKTEKKQNIATTMIAVDEKETAFPMKLKLEQELIE